MRRVWCRLFSKWENQVSHEAKLSQGRSIRDNVMNILENEFKGEKISSVVRAENKLNQELIHLNLLNKNIPGLSGTALKTSIEDFNFSRKKALNLRFELTVQREMSGMAINCSSTVEADYPIPPAI